MKRIWVGLLAIVLAFTLTAAAFAEGLTAEDEFSEYVDAPVEELEAFAIGEEEIDAPEDDAGPAPEALEGDQAVLAAPADGVEVDGEYGVSAVAGIPINKTYFPDPCFATYVQSYFDLNHDSILSTSEREAVTDIDVKNQGISSLSGLQYFPNLESLDCDDNNLTTLDLRSNTKLTGVSCSNNKLTSLNVSGCAKLHSLECENNKLTSLDVSKNPNLYFLACADNNIERLIAAKGSEIDTFYNTEFNYGVYDGDGYFLEFDPNMIVMVDGVAVDGCSRTHVNYDLNKTGSNGTINLTAGDARQIVPRFALKKYWRVVSYTTNKPDVVYIDNGGLAVAKAEGTATITVKTKQGKKGSVKIKVTDPNKPTKLTVNQGKKATLNLDKTLKLTATLSPSTAKSTLTFKSSKPKVATVDANGIVTPKKEGTTKITVTAKGNKKAKATITVKVVDPYKPKKLTINQGKKATLDLDKTLKLTATLSPSTARSALTFKSSKPKVATVDESGLVKPLKEGTTKITVTAKGNKKAKATITIKVVDPYKPKKLTINQGKKATLAPGDTLKLSATLSPATARSALTWKSSKNSVATVDADGNVKALKAGTAKITVTAKGNKKAKATFTVKVKKVKAGDVKFPIELTAGGTACWTELTIYSDWTFKGNYGWREDGWGSPSGTGTISGKMTDVSKAGDKTYKMKIGSYSAKEDGSNSDGRDNVYGIRGKGDTLYLYLPGIDSNRIKGWTGSREASTNRYYLFNQATNDLFFVYVY